VEPVTLSHGGRDRLYLLHLAQHPARPLLLVLHGTGGTAAWAEEELGWLRVAVQEDFNLAIPEGLPPNPDQPARFLSNPPRWNDGSEFVLSLPTTPPDDVDFLTRVLNDALQRCHADPQRVYLTGFSNGAGMSFRFASERSELLAAVVPVAGYCWVPEPRPRHPLATLYIVGSADPLIPLNGGPARLPWGSKFVERPTVASTLERWAVGLGCSPMPLIQSDTQGIRIEAYPGPVLFQAMIVEGLGHHWPGGKGQLNPRIGGLPSNKLRANEVIWSFCKGQSR